MPGCTRTTVALVLALAAAPASAAQQQPDPELVRLVQDYTGLYTRGTFASWSRLFDSSFTSLSTNADGTVTLRTLEEFLDAQQRGFATARDMREELENVRIEQHGRLASVWADFVFFYEGRARRGRLVLLAAQDNSGWKFHSLMFSYNR